VKEDAAFRPAQAPFLVAAGVVVARDGIAPSLNWTHVQTSSTDALRGSLDAGPLSP